MVTVGFFNDGEENLNCSLRYGLSLERLAEFDLITRNKHTINILIDVGELIDKEDLVDVDF